MLLQERGKWQQPKRNLTKGDIVILGEENVRWKVWSLGIVIQTEPDQQGFVRSVIVKTQESSLRRPVNKLILLLPKQDQQGDEE